MEPLLLCCICGAAETPVELTEIVLNLFLAIEFVEEEFVSLLEEIEFVNLALEMLFDSLVSIKGSLSATFSFFNLYGVLVGIID